jgi:hypothetical protein
LKRQFIEKFIITAPPQKAKKQKEKSPYSTHKNLVYRKKLVLMAGPAFTGFFARSRQRGTQREAPKARRQRRGDHPQGRKSARVKKFEERER